MVLVLAPDIVLSHERALSFLNEKFISLDTSGESLRAAAAESVSQKEALQKEVQSLIAKRCSSSLR
jgi:prefoldin subunit 5